jgi:hypothetical protein
MEIARLLVQPEYDSVNIFESWNISMKSDMGDFKFCHPESN